MDSEDDDNVYLSDGPVSRSGLADVTRSGSDPEDDNASVLDLALVLAVA